MYNGRMIICFDFDGVCMQYDDWKGKDVFDAPIKETAALTRKLHEQGHRVILWATRAKTEALGRWLAQWFLL